MHIFIMGMYVTELNYKIIHISVCVYVYTITDPYSPAADDDRHQGVRWSEEDYVQHPSTSI